MEEKLIFKRVSLLKMFFCLLLLIILSNCTLIPCGLDSGIDKIKEEQTIDFFVGEYVVEKFINDGNNLNIDDLSIKINENKVLEINNIHGYILDLRLNKKVNVKAKWKPVYYKGENFLSVDYKFSKKDSLENYGASWKIYKKNNKPILLINIGDPDYCSAIRFIKK